MELARALQAEGELEVEGEITAETAREVQREKVREIKATGGSIKKGTTLSTKEGEETGAAA